jgi:hypothetical protein
MIAWTNQRKKLSLTPKPLFSMTPNSALYDEEGIKGWEEDEYLDDEEEVEWETPTFHKSRRKK